MISGKSLLNYTNSFSPNKYKKNGNIIYRYFHDKYEKENIIICFRLKKIDETKIYFLDQMKN